MQAKRAQRGRGATRRTRKIWLAVLGTAAGTLVVVGLGLWLAARRETDLADPRSGVTAGFRDVSGKAAPPIRFTEVAARKGITMRHGPGPRTRRLPEDTGSGLAWGDVDGDGDWDLYIVNFPDPANGEGGEAGWNRLYRNDGDRFTDVTASAGVGDPEGFGMGASFADFDEDGDLDLYVTNYGPNRLFKNRGDGTFTEVGAAAGVADALWSTGAAWGDFDRDGHLDLYVCNYLRYDAGDVGPESFRKGQTGGYSIPFTLNPNSFDPAPNRLYRNRGDGTFEEVSERCGVSDPEGRSLAAAFCDLDGDGWLDLYVNNDVSPSKLFRNLGGDLPGGGPPQFADLSNVSGTADTRGAMGLSVGEVGGMTGEPDGLPDLFVTHWIAEENAFYQSLVTPGGNLEYRDKTRQFDLGEISLDVVGWGCALADFDLDGLVDIAVVNGSTLERKEDPLQLVADPMFLFWNEGKRFQNVAPAAGEAFAGRHCARGLAAADFDGDGDVDLAVSINRGAPLLLRNDTESAHQALRIRLRGPDSARFGARLEVRTGSGAQFRWEGADVTYLGMHAPEHIFGLGPETAAREVRVRWADGSESRLADVPAGSLEIAHPRRPEASAPRAGTGG